MKYRVIAISAFSLSILMLAFLVVREWRLLEKSTSKLEEIGVEFQDYVHPNFTDMTKISNLQAEYGIIQPSRYLPGFIGKKLFNLKCNRGPIIAIINDLSIDKSNGRSFESIDSLIAMDIENVNGLNNIDFTNFNKLDYLSIHECDLDNETIQKLLNHSSIKKLELSIFSNNPVTVDSTNLKELIFVFLGEPPVNFPSAANLAKSSTLESLSIHGADLSPQFYEQMASSRVLSLDVAQSTFNDISASKLSSNTSLVHLDISYAKITRSGLMNIAKITSLESIRVMECMQLTCEDFIDFLKVNPNVEIKNRPWCEQLDGPPVDFDKDLFNPSSDLF